MRQTFMRNLIGDPHRAPWVPARVRARAGLLLVSLVVWHGGIGGLWLVLGWCCARYGFGRSTAYGQYDNPSGSRSEQW